MDIRKDPYDKAFSDSIIYADTFGAKLGRWLNLGGWKIIAIVGTTLAILSLGTVQFIRSFGTNLFKKPY
jgi:hypothetical protein